MSCPLGYICRKDGSERFPCSAIQDKALRFRIGDVYAGIYCPAGEDAIKNCDEGYYCPNPSTKLMCPSKYYCPHKTAKFSMSCSACGEGSTSYARPIYGYLIFVTLALIGLAYVIFRHRKERETKFRDKLKDLGNRVLGIDEEKQIREKHQKRLERLEPRLEAMEKKLGEDDILVTNKEGVRIFDAELLYTKLDVDKSGDLSYEELNNVLNLKPRELIEFMSYMNQLGGADEGELNVTKETFVHHFLETLDRASNFGPSSEDAERLFTQLMEDLDGTDSQGLDISRLGETRLSSFLTETQIVGLKNKFRPLAIKAESTRELRSLPSSKNNLSSTRRFFVSTVSVGVLMPESTYSVASSVYLEKEIFVQYYSTFLAEVKEEGIPEEISSNEMIDITFQNLSLHVTVKEEKKAVVNNVTGRIHQKTMTALLGGSGAGKTSLLNALCGRAFYGEVSGDIYINGQKASIDDHKSAVGFVPQDDIVYPELTVKENFMFAGKFQLPSLTSTAEIEQLAESTMASLGLTRVAHSIVGDVHIRGVSGGEKKRVNIGLELMARPRILFLDEPTSGLDASSAMLVMKSLKGLVSNNAMTIVAVIHQPRKSIFELFDSIILLGVGGKMVYHGPVYKVEDYFSNLRYYLPVGENVADWLIDISSGSVSPEVQLSDPTDQFGSFRLKKTQHRIQQSATEMDWVTKMKLNREKLFKDWESFANSNEDVKNMFQPPEQYSLPPTRKRSNFFFQLLTNLRRNLIVIVRQKKTKLINLFILLAVTAIMSLLDGTAKLTEESHPTINYEYDLLTSSDPGTFMGTLPAAFKYAAAAKGMPSYAMKVGVISSVLLGLSAAKNFNDKRVEFFREAGSGYSINAFFLAVHLTTLFEQVVMVVITAAVAQWLRNSFNEGHVFLVNFIMMDWVVVAWGLLFPLFIPPENVIIVTGCFMAYCGIQFSGQLAPVNFKDMYNNKALLIFASFFSPVRFFVEQMAVSEQRALPPQSGFTQEDDYNSLNFPMEFNSFNLIGSAQLDIDTVKRQSRSGWDWPLIRALMIGLTLRALSFGLINMCNRQRQCKKPLMEEYKGPDGKKKVLIPFIIGTSIFLVLFSITLSMFAS